jgi:hypothetical protein
VHGARMHGAHMADILLIYERTDRRRVAPIVALLEARGWSVQWEPAGDATEPPAVGCIIAAWSIDSVDSDAVWAVAGEGLARGVLISVSIDFSRVPRELEQAPSLALAGWTGDASSARAQELLAVVDDLLARAAAARPPQPDLQPAVIADLDPHPVPARAADLAAEQEPVFEPEAEPEPEPEPEPDIEPEPWPKLALQLEVEPEVAFQVEPEAAFEPTRALPVLRREEGITEPVWAFPEEPEEETQASRLPPVLLRERGHQHVAPSVAPEEVAPPTSLARRSLAAGLVIGLMIVGAAGVLWLMPREPMPGSTPGGEVAAVETAPKPVATTPTDPVPSQVRSQEVKQETGAQKIKPQEAAPQAATPEAPGPQANLQDVSPQATKTPEAKPKEVQPTPAALPKDVEIEDLLGQVTPRVEELLTDARRLIRIGEIRRAREVLAAPETANSGSLTFLLAETYDPNVLPTTLKSTLADPQRARSLYRRARDLGEGRAQGRLDALKTSGCAPLACPAAGLLG